MRRALIPADTDTGAARRLYEIQQQKREHAAELAAQQIIIDNAAEAEILRLVSMLENIGK